MKKLAMMMVLTIAVGFGATAQSGRTKLTEEQKKEVLQKMEAFKAELKLTEEQQPRFEAINLEFAEALENLKAGSGSKIGQLRKLRAATDDRNKKMKSLLTAEQYKLFQAQQEKVKKDFKARRG